MALNTFLGRALTDPATGLPNVPYFSLIREYETGRARRRQTMLRVLNVLVRGGAERVRRSLSWRLCQELRGSDLIASEGREHFHILLTTPDAENADSLSLRLQEIAGDLNRRNPGDDPLLIDVEVETTVLAGSESSPCTPCDEQTLEMGREADAAAHRHVNEGTVAPGEQPPPSASAGDAEPSHPVGTGAGAMSMGAAAAAIGGVVGGPLGALVGAAVGAMAGGMAGREISERVNPAAEEEYWRDRYPDRPYARADISFNQYRDAYKFGWESRCRLASATWADAEPQLRGEWDAKGESLTWEQARPAVRDAWDRVEVLIAEYKADQNG